MRKYQVRFFDDSGTHIRQESLSSKGDKHAASAMMQGADGHAMQLWDDKRKVHDLSKQSSGNCVSARDKSVDHNPWDIGAHGARETFVPLSHQHVSGDIYHEQDSLSHWSEVYFIHDRDAEIVNVGCALDGWPRLDKLRTRTGHAIAWLGCIYGEGGEATLSEVCGEFPRSRMARNWYRASPELLRRAEDARVTYAREAFGNVNARVTKRMGGPLLQGC